MLKVISILPHFITKNVEILIHIVKIFNIFLLKRIRIKIFFKYFKLGEDLF